jgi:hypothetical protein
MFQSQSWPNLWYFLFRFLKSCMDNKKPLLLLNIDSMPSRRGGSGLYFFFHKKENKYVVFCCGFFSREKYTTYIFFSWMCFIKISLVTSFRIVHRDIFFREINFSRNFSKKTWNLIFGSLYSLFST